MKNNIKDSLNALQLSDVYSLMFFILYKLHDAPEYATLSELCYLLDGSNTTRLLSYFEGKTIKIPTATEFIILANALLLYQYINLNGESFAVATEKLTNLTLKQKDQAIELYLKIIPIMEQYNIDRGQISKYDR